MAISREPVTPRLVTLWCDECGGKMRPTGRVLDSMPPKYVHRCESCGTETNEDDQYPMIDYEVTE